MDICFFFFHFLATVNKAALNIHVQGFVFIFILFNSFWQCLAACGILVPWPGVKPTSPALGAWSVGHWTAGEVQVFDGDVFTSTGHTPRSGAGGSRCNSAPQTQLPWPWALPPQLSSAQWVRSAWWGWEDVASPCGGTATPLGGSPEWLYSSLCSLPLAISVLCSLLSSVWKLWFYFVQFSVVYSRRDSQLLHWVWKQKTHI